MRESEWCSTAVGPHLRLTSGFPFASSHFGSDGLPLIRIRDVQGATTATRYKGPVPPGYIVKRGDILVAMDGDFHVVRWQGDDALLNQRVLKVDVVDESVVAIDYLFHWLGPHIRKVNQITAATTVKHLSTRDLLNATVKLPPVGVQRRISNILSSIDTTIEKTETLIAKYQHIKAGLMHDLFTRGVLPNGQLRPPREQAPELYRETAVGWIPKDWQPTTCGESCVIDSGITLGPHRRPNKRAYPYLRVANVHRDEIRLGDLASMEIFPGEETLALKKFDLLIVEGHANRSEIGRCAMVEDSEEGLLFQNHLFRLRTTNSSPNYLLLWMNSHYAQRYWERSCATSSGLNTINRRTLKALPLFIPEVSEQNRIAASLEVAKSQIHQFNRTLLKLRDQKLGLMQDLLTGKVQVKTDTPEAVMA